MADKNETEPKPQSRTTNPNTPNDAEEMSLNPNQLIPEKIHIKSSQSKSQRNSE